MSLINEALKRAREEAARRKALEKGLPLAAPGPVRDRSRGLTIAVVVLGSALLISMAVLISLSFRLPATPPLPAVAATGEPQPAGSEHLDGPSVVEYNAETKKKGASETSPSLPAIVDDPPPALAPDTGSSAAIPSGAGIPATETSPEPLAEAVSGIQTDDGERDSSVFVGQARLRDGQVVDLEGIAWSESEPFALLNGQVLGVGERIRTYRVVEIQPSQVVLEKDDHRIVLRLK